MNIRAATADDIVALAPQLAGLALFASYDMTADRLQARWLTAVQQKQSLLVATDTDGPVGLAWFLQQGTFSSGAYLKTIAVIPRAQSRGVGTLLLQAFEQHCKDASGGCFLLVSHFNHDAQKFYLRHGYHEVGALPAFAHPHITERIFWKKQC